MSNIRILCATINPSTIKDLEEQKQSLKHYHVYQEEDFKWSIGYFYLASFSQVDVIIKFFDSIIFKYFELK